MSQPKNKHWMVAGAIYQWKQNESAGMMHWKPLFEEKYHPLDYFPISRNSSYMVFPAVFQATIQGISNLIVDHTLLLKLEGLWAHSFQDKLKEYLMSVTCCDGQPVLEFYESEVLLPRRVGFSPLTVVNVERLTTTGTLSAEG